MNDDAQQLEHRLYVDVLKIPVTGGPPNHYELLGLRVGESDPTVIEAGARRRMSLLRKDIPAELQRSARIVLRRVAVARICLLDPAARAAYNATLQQATSAPGRTDRRTRPAADVPSGSQRTSFGATATRSAAKNPHEQTLDRLASEPCAKASAHDKTRNTIPPGAGDASSAPQRSPSHGILLPDDSGELEVEPPISRPPPQPLFNLRKPVSVKTQTASRRPRVIYAVVATGIVSVLVNIVLFLQWSSPPKKTANLRPGAASNVAVHRGNTMPARKRSSRTGKATVTSESSIIPGQSAGFTANTGKPVASNAADPMKPVAADGTRLSVGPNRGIVAPTATGLVVPAVITVNPFGKLPVEVVLPPLRSSDSAVVDNAERSVDIGPIGPPTEAGLQVSLSQPVPVEGTRTHFVVVSATSGTPCTAWEIRLHSDATAAQGDVSVLDKIGQGIDALVATFYLEDGQLKFKWIANKYPAFAEQLRNCTIRLKDASNEHRFQLRPCKCVPPVVMDFDMPIQEFVISENALPPKSSIFLEIISLDHFDVDIEQQPSDGIVPFGETFCIWFKEWQKNAVTQIKFTGSGDEPCVMITSRYRLGSRWQPFTIERVTDTLTDLKRTLETGKSRLVNATAAANAIPGRISALEARARVSRDLHEVGLLAGQIRQLQRQLKNAYSSIRRFSRTVQKTGGETLPAMVELCKLGDKVHKIAQIRFRVVVKMQGQDDKLELMKTVD